MISERVSKALKISFDLMVWEDHHPEYLNIGDSKRLRLGATLIHLFLEHHRAICLLTNKELFASAAAMVRIAYETCVRGLWFIYCATDVEIDRFISGDKIKKHIGKLVEEIEEVEHFKHGFLSDSKKESWDLLNSLTHSGMQQLSRRYREGEISSNFSDEEVIDALDGVNKLGLLAMMAIFHAAADAELLDAWTLRVEKYFEKNL